MSRQPPSVILGEKSVLIEAYMRATSMNTRFCVHDTILINYFDFFANKRIDGRLLMVFEIGKCAPL